MTFRKKADREANERAAVDARYEPLRSLETGVARSAEEIALIDRETDILVQLVARHIWRSADPSDPAMEPFLEWLARKARQELPPRERAELARRASEFADRVCLNPEVACARLTTVEGSPERTRPPEGLHLGELVSLGSRQRRVPALDLAVAAGLGRALWSESCDEWLTLPDELPSGRYLALTVRGESMTPVLHSGDVILLRLGSRLEQGAVVVVRHPENGYVVKCIGALLQERVKLVSFNTDYPPVEIPRDDSLVLGTVILRWCKQALPRRSPRRSRG